MAVMVGGRGLVVGIDHIPELVDFSIRNGRKNYSHLLDSGRVKLLVGDGRKGFPPAAPYDAIHVGAASNGLPEALVAQLAPGQKER